jgi:hypothetical protein
MRVFDARAVMSGSDPTEAFVVVPNCAAARIRVRSRPGPGRLVP